MKSKLYFVILLFVTSTVIAQSTLTLKVDARKAPEKWIHSTSTLTVKPGPLTLIFPKYIPGEHGPTGPIQGVTGLSFKVSGKSLPWHRDAVDMFRIHLQIPSHSTQLETQFDFLTPVGSGAFTAGISATPNLFVINWNQLLFYPEHTQGDALSVKTELLLPKKWHIGTALPVKSRKGNQVKFKTVSLETLIDSPLISAKHFREVDISVKGAPKHYIDIVSDSEDALNISQADIKAHKQLVSQTGYLFGARHYKNYHFLLTLSDHTAHFGLEHHQSSDDRTPENLFTDKNSRIIHGGLLPHEFVHSWNGKYRRPQGIATGNYDTPMQTQMLWVYEGLTTYLGDVLTARSGLWSEKNYRDYLALSAATLDHRTGRRWRPLQDTTTAAQILYSGPRDRQSWRRRVDFYQEGELIWLEADSIIRNQSHGKKSLDNFVKRFYGMEDGVVRVNPFTFDDTVSALNKTSPYDWAKFLHSRLDRTGNGAPLNGLKQNGWKLGYQSTRNQMQKLREKESKSIDEMYSVGLMINQKGMIVDVLIDSAADHAGISAGMQVVAVNNREWNGERFRKAIAATKHKGTLNLLIKEQGFYSTHLVKYHGGSRYAVLTRIKNTEDGLMNILKARTK